MSPQPIHEIYQLPDDAFTQIIRDIELMQKGCQIHYMVDSHEIIDYCFPLDPSGYSECTPEQIADDQAALYEAFYGRSLRPILIPDYEGEVRRHLAYLEITAQRAYDDLDLVQLLLGDATLDTIKGLSKDEILKRMEVEFNVLLAVAMGIYSIGVKRFHQIVSTRIRRIGDLGNPFVAETHAAYRETALFRAIREDLVRPLANQNLVSSEVKRRIRAAEIDARAVDWLLHLNKAVETKYEKDLRDRPVFVYLSSAPRTKRIFSSPSVRKVRLKLAGEPYSIQRDRTQLLALLVCRERAGEANDWHDRAIENLDDLRKLSGKIRQLEERGPVNENARCANCVLNGRVPSDCTNLDICKEVVRREDLRASIPNLGLLGELPRYSQLIQSKPRNQRQEWCLQVFRDLMDTENIGDLAIAKMKTILNIGAADTAVGGGSEIANLPESSDEPSDMALLPVPLVLHWPMHAQLADEIFKIPSRLRDNPAQDDAILLHVVEAFDELDRRVSLGETGEGFDMAEHELLRCLVYMTFGLRRGDRQKGDVMALEYAEKMVLKYPRLTPEFDYIITWTARRLGRFQQAHNAANRSVELRPEDPRFYHGRSVNIICWLEDENAKRFCPREAEDAIDDAVRAIELYSAGPSPPKRVISLHFNNVAWLRCHDWRSKEYDLDQARSMMERLQVIFPESEWLPGFPEYFHTKACIAFEEYRVSKTQRSGSAAGMPTEHLAEKLEEADGALRKALGVLELDEWKAMANQIHLEKRALARRAWHS